MASKSGKKAQRPGEEIRGNKKFPLKGGRASPWSEFSSLQRVALPQPARSLSANL